MWPSFETASSAYNLANVFLVGALVVGVIATLVVVWMGNVKEEYLRRDIAGAHERGKAAEERAAEANKIAEQERLARVKIEEKLAPRRITQKDQQYISTQISEFKGVVGGIGSSPRDIESMRLESGIHAALAEGGWNLAREIPSHTPMWPGGVAVSSSLDKASQVAGVKLALALNSVGIFATFMPMLESATPRVFVTVGPKPDSDDPLLKINLDVLKQIALELQKQ